MSPRLSSTLFNNNGNSSNKCWSASLLGLLIGGLVQTCEQGAYVMLSINATPSYKTRIWFAAFWALVVTSCALMMAALCRQVVKMTILSQLYQHDNNERKKSIAHHQSILHKTDLRLLLGALVGAECSFCVVEIMVNSNNNGMWRPYGCMLVCWLGLGMSLQYCIEKTVIGNDCSNLKEKDDECDDVPLYSELA